MPVAKVFMYRLFLHCASSLCRAKGTPLGHSSAFEAFFGHCLKRETSFVQSLLMQFKD